MPDDVKERNYALSPDEVKALQAEYAETKRVPNPHKAGAYRFTIEALVALGADKAHPAAKVFEAFRKAAGPEWFARWEAKAPRNAETGKDAQGRFLQNIATLQRVNDYGRRLLEVGQKVLKSKGCAIDLTRNGDELQVRLNTDTATPLKPSRSSAAAAPQKPTRKPANKSAKAKAAKGGTKAAGAKRQRGKGRK